MIQRTQTVFLLVGALLLASIPFLPIVSTGVAADSLTWYVPSVAGLAGLSAVTAVVSIFLYKDRTRQLRLVGALNFAVILVAAVAYAGLYLSGALQLTRPSADLPGMWAAVLVPVGAYVMLVLARRGIQRDINLVRSVDRLRD